MYYQKFYCLTNGSNFYKDKLLSKYSIIRVLKLYFQGESRVCLDIKNKLTIISFNK